MSGSGSGSGSDWGGVSGSELGRRFAHARGDCGASTAFPESTARALCRNPYHEDDWIRGGSARCSGCGEWAPLGEFAWADGSGRLDETLGGLRAGLPLRARVAARLASPAGLALGTLALFGWHTRGSGAGLALGALMGAALGLGLGGRLRAAAAGAALRAERGEEAEREEEDSAGDRD